MKVLVACEESQAVTIELRKLGHEAFSCDIIECSGGHPEWHIMKDVLEILNPKEYKTAAGSWHGGYDFEIVQGIMFSTCDRKAHFIRGKWDMIIAFPPCTYLSNAGACRLYPKKGQLNMERYQKGLEAKEFFLKFLNADCPRIAVENPVSSKVFDMPQHTQEIQPYEYQRLDDEEQVVHPYTKKTRLWLKGVPKLVPTSPDAVPIGPYCPAGTGRKDPSKYGSAKRGEDAKNRAKTFLGIAKAMAEQWAGEA